MVATLHCDNPRQLLASTVVPNKELLVHRGQCLYKTGKCQNERALKSNGEAHTLCEFHRSRQNRHQRKRDFRIRQNKTQSPLTPNTNSTITTSSSPHHQQQQYHFQPLQLQQQKQQQMEHNHHHHHHHHHQMDQQPQQLDRQLDNQETIHLHARTRTNNNNGISFQHPATVLPSFKTFAQGKLPNNCVVISHRTDSEDCNMDGDFTRLVRRRIDSAEYAETGFYHHPTRVFRKEDEQSLYSSGSEQYSPKLYNSPSMHNNSPRYQNSPVLERRSNHRLPNSDSFLHCPRRTIPSIVTVIPENSLTKHNEILLSPHRSVRNIATRVSTLHLPLTNYNDQHEYLQCSTFAKGRIPANDALRL